MSLVWILSRFDPRGRLSRRAYARLVVRLLLLSALLLCVVISLGAQGWRMAAFAAAGGFALPGVAGLAQTIRRLHDRDRTAWWLAIPLISTALSFVPVETQADAHPLAVVAFTLVILTTSFWFLIETLGRRGTSGPNRYGHEPLRR